MFRIGDFSRLARVSARLLRFYDEIGLFVPAHADRETGYRHYTAAQLPQLNRILVLKELGFELEQVRRMLGTELTEGELRHMLTLRRNDAARAMALEAQRLQQLESRITLLATEGGVPAADVAIRCVPASDYLSVRTVLPSFDAAREQIARVRELARPWLKAGVATRLVAVAHSPDFEADALDVEFGYVFEDGFRDSPPRGGELRLRELEAVERMAVCVRVGLPEEAHLVTAQVARFLEAGGDRLAGPSREVFLRPPVAGRMHESVVEMQFPVAHEEPPAARAVQPT